MHKEPVFKAALWVVFFWVAVYNVIHPFHLVFDASQWIVPGLTLGAILVGAAVAFWLAVDLAGLRIERLKPVSHMGVVPSIGELPLHLREAKFDVSHLRLSKEGGKGAAVDTRESLRAAFEWLRTDPAMIPQSMRRSEMHVDGIDLNAIEQAILAHEDPYVAVFDKVLRVFIAHRDLLSTYEPDGHGRRNGVGGSTLLQHALLVCQCAIDRAPTFEFHGMYAVDRKGERGNLVYPLRDNSALNLKNDPIVLLAALSHDIGKIECYVRDEGAALPRLLPNHDIIGARMLGRMPELWALPKRTIRGIEEDDRTLLITIIAFYHHPSEQPMLSAPRQTARAQSRRDGFGDVMVRSDRQVAIMELLIEIDLKAGAIEHDKVALQCDAVGGQSMEPGDAPRPAAPAAPDAVPSPKPPRAPTMQLTPEMVKAMLWESVEMVLAQQGRINATFVQGSVTSGSFGLLFQLPHWGGTTLILKESDFVNAVIETSDLPETWKRAQRVAEGDMDRSNTVAPATAFLMRLFAERSMLVTPPGMPEHSPETSLWKVAFHPPTHVYPTGDFALPPKSEPTGKPDFRWGSTIVLRPGKHFPGLQDMDGYKKAPVCIGERVGAAGRLGARKAAKKGAERRSILDDDEAILATTDVEVAHALLESESQREIENLASQIEAAGGLEQLAAATGHATEPVTQDRVDKAAQYGQEFKVFVDQLEAFLRHGQLPFMPVDGASVLISHSLEALAQVMGMRFHALSIVEYSETQPGEGVRMILCTTASGAHYHAVILRPIWFQRRGFEPVLPGDGEAAPQAGPGADRSQQQGRSAGPEHELGEVVEPPQDAPGGRKEPTWDQDAGEPLEGAVQAPEAPEEADEASGDDVEAAARTEPVEREAAVAAQEEGEEVEAFAFQAARSSTTASPRRSPSPGEAVSAFDLVAFEAVFLDALRSGSASGALKLFRLDDPRNGEDVVVCSTPLWQLLPKLGVRWPSPPIEEWHRNGFGLTPTKDRGDLIVRILPRWFMERRLDMPDRPGS